MNFLELFKEVAPYLAAIITGIISWIAARRTNNANAKKTSVEADSLIADNYEKFIGTLEKRLADLEAENAVLKELDSKNTKRIGQLELKVQELTRKLEAL